MEEIKIICKLSLHPLQDDVIVEFGSDKAFITPESGTVILLGIRLLGLGLLGRKKLKAR